MKTIGRLKLNQFSKAELEQRQMNALRGGTGCSCGCSCDCTCCCSRNTDPEASLGRNSSRDTMAPDAANNSAVSISFGNGNGYEIPCYTYKL